MTKRRTKFNQGGFVWLIVLGLVGLVLLIAVLLRGTDVALFNPKGLIAKQQHHLMIYTAGIMLTIAVPSVLLLYFIAWKYRESNVSAAYDPDLRHGKWFNFNVWAVPTVFMLVLATMMWPATHKLQPRKLIFADTKPLVVQVVSLRWKWLFLYPEQGIATINFVQVPINTAVQFELTADTTPMSSFWIPNLGGQLYSMTGHVNRLNLIADTPGDYPGSSAELNGAGFSGMKFTARASNAEDFDLWVQEVKQSGDALDTTKYEKILEPSENNPTAYFSAYETSLYDKVVLKYNGPSETHLHHQ